MLQPCLHSQQDRRVEAPVSLVRRLLFLLCVVSPVDLASGVQVSVLDFGAKGDGISDDFPAISSALASLNNSGTLFFPSASSSFPSSFGGVIGGRYALSQPLVVSGYAVHLRGEGARPSLVSRAGAGSSLLSLTGNSSLVIFDGCTFCSMSGFLLSHTSMSREAADESVQQSNAVFYSAANNNHQPAADCRLRHLAATKLCQLTSQQEALARTLEMSMPHDGKTPWDSAVVPAAVPAALSKQQQQQQHLGWKMVPSSGAAITVRRSFQVTLSNLWIDSVYRALWITTFANTVTLLDSQLSNVFGDCGSSLCSLLLDLRKMNSSQVF